LGRPPPLPAAEDLDDLEDSTEPEHVPTVKE
jgi:hypothetical protein